jgi:hypothetical protein
MGCVRSLNFDATNAKSDWLPYKIVFSSSHGRLLWPDGAHAYKAPSVLLGF